VAEEPNPRDLGIYFLDVGQGDCTVIVPPKGDGGAIVFDIADQFVLERFVANHGLRVSDVIASHLDIDHIRGMLGFLRNHMDAIDRVYLGTDRKPEPGQNRNLRELVEQIDAWGEGRPMPNIIPKDNWRDHEGPVTIREGKDWKVEIILPFNTTRHKVELRDGQHPNVVSAVLRIEREGTAVLVGGDAKEEAKAWKTYGDLYDRVNAELAVISVGTNNPKKWSHPHADHVEAIRRGGRCRTLCTQLTPRCHEHPLELRGIMMERATMVEPPYRHWKRGSTEVPCAGTIAVWIDGSGELHHEPSRSSEHSKLLLRVDDPMCERDPRVTADSA